MRLEGFDQHPQKLPISDPKFVEIRVSEPFRHLQVTQPPTSPRSCRSTTRSLSRRASRTPSPQPTACLSPTAFCEPLTMNIKCSCMESQSPYNVTVGTKIWFEVRQRSCPWRSALAMDSLSNSKILNTLETALLVIHGLIEPSKKHVMRSCRSWFQWPDMLFCGAATTSSTRSLRSSSSARGRRHRAMGPLMLVCPLQHHTLPIALSHISAAHGMDLTGMRT